jgi:hypothetical protein
VDIAGLALVMITILTGRAQPLQGQKVLRGWRLSDHRPYRVDVTSWRNGTAQGEAVMFQRTSPSHHRPVQLLIETDDPSLTIADFTTFLEAGFDVTVCGGPDMLESCPALDGYPCPLVDSADVIVNEIRDSVTRHEIARTLRALTPDVPILVHVRPGREDTAPAGCIPLATTTSVNGQIAAIRKAAVNGDHARARAGTS